MSHPLNTGFILASDEWALPTYSLILLNCAKTSQVKIILRVSTSWLKTVTAPTWNTWRMKRLGKGLYHLAQNLISNVPVFAPEFWYRPTVTVPLSSYCVYCTDVQAHMTKAHAGFQIKGLPCLVCVFKEACQDRMTIRRWKAIFLRALMRPHAIDLIWSKPLELGLCADLNCRYMVSWVLLLLLPGCNTRNLGMARKPRSVQYFNHRNKISWGFSKPAKLPMDERRADNRVCKSKSKFQLKIDTKSPLSCHMRESVALIPIWIWKPLFRKYCFLYF